MNNQLTQHKIGDVVILKSGGPTMTVHAIDDYSNLGLAVGVLCVWFDHSKRVEDVFHPDTTQRYTDG
ncbi:YodC family protein [Hydrogenophaga sp.]|uniref:YodC family protein n=1 Tax=Hydrogenophaga sp. TaxID=1904254 RepID=UPI003F6E873A